MPESPQRPSPSPHDPLFAATQDRHATDPSATKSHVESEAASTVTLAPPASTVADAAPHAQSAAFSIPGYEIIGELGRGGMGLVLHGRDANLGRDVAVKVLLDRHRHRPNLEQRFVREARINGRLQHPGVVPVYELGRFADQLPYFAMKLVEGRTLAALLKGREHLAEDRPRFLKIFEQICQTLAYAHSRSVIHRDLKPANVMVGAFGEVQVMDWGLGKNLAPRQAAMPHKVVSELPADAPEGISTHADAGERFVTASRIGTPAYMPPEQALGELERVDERSDVFGLGAILCEILTAHPPFLEFRGDPTADELRADLADAHNRLESSGADAELISLARRCLVADPAERPRNAGLLADEVTAYLESVDARLRQAELDRAAAEVEAREQRRRRKLTLGLASAVVMMLALLGGGALWRQSQSAETQRNVEAALAKAEQSREQFRQMPLGNARQVAAAIATLRQAHAAADEADNVLETGVADQELAARVTSLRSEIAPQLAQLEKEEKLFRDLNAARLSRMSLVLTDPEDYREGGLEPPGSVLDRFNYDFAATTGQYQSAFAAMGLEVATAPQASLARHIAEQRPEVREALIIALDDWALSARKQGPTAVPSTRRLSELAQAVDFDSWRREIRQAALEQDVERFRAAAANALEGTRSPASLENVALIMNELRDTEQAIGLLRRATIQHGGDFWLHYFLGVILSERQDLTDAQRQEVVQCYLAALALAPESAVVHGNLGASLTKVNDPQRAVAAFRRAIQRDPQYLPAHLNLGHALSMCGDLEGAITAYQELLRLHPRLARAHFALGVAYLEKNDLVRATQAFEQAIGISPRFANAHHHLGVILVKTNRFDEAITKFREVVRLRPRHVQAHIRLGIEFRRKKQWQDAINAYREAVKINRRLPGVHTDLAECLYALNRFDLAIKSCTNAISLDPQLAPAHYFLGLAKIGKKDLGGAETALQAAINLNPRYSLAHYNLGTIYARKNEFARAEDSFRSALEHDAGLAEAHYGLGNALVMQRNYDAAVAAYQRAVEIKPDFAQAYYNLGEAHAQRGDFARAKDATQRYLELLASNDPLWAETARRVENFTRLIGPAAGAEPVEAE